LVLPSSPASRIELVKLLKPLEGKACPFANLPEKKAGCWNAGLTPEKMRECHWVTPVLIGQFEFLSNGRMTATYGTAVLLRFARTKKRGTWAGNSYVIGGAHPHGVLASLKAADISP
jgi:hypothetical protein